MVSFRRFHVYLNYEATYTISLKLDLDVYIKPSVRFLI